MARDEQQIGNCSQCGGAPLICRFNRFQDEPLRILSWEHRCDNCGYRETKAFRSDDIDPPQAGVDPEVCPFCGRAAPAC